jgi:cytochrome c556
MVDMFAAMTKMQTEIAGYAQPDEFEKWLIDSEEYSRKLVAALTAAEGGDRKASDQAQKYAKAIKNRCSACHKKHRND